MSCPFKTEVQEDPYGYCPQEQEPKLDPSNLSIYKVPHSIRKGKEEAYTPQMVSIGPLHCHKKELTGINRTKCRYKEKFFKRTAKKPEEVLNSIRALDQDIRSCYSEISNLEKDDYAEMILRDAIFILELLLMSFEEDVHDKLLRIPADRLALKLDLLLLENQLPYCLLEKIYNSIVSSPSFKDICLKFFRSLFFYRTASDKKDIKHFTDLLRDALVQHYPAREKCSVNDEVEEDDHLTPLPCATKLHKSGVKFTVDSSRRLLSIEFKGGELKMPRFEVHHQTETMLRNIMALEQCQYPRDTIVCNYVILLSDLIEDKRDVQLLVDAGIISNYIGDSKILATLFNKVGAESPTSGNHYKKIYKDLKEYYNNKYNRNMAKLRRVYFGDIFKSAATIVASVLLIRTFLDIIGSLKQ